MEINQVLHSRDKLKLGGTVANASIILECLIIPPCIIIIILKNNNICQLN